jgi:hypothetical protein
LTVALCIVAGVALAAFALVLVLARRLRAVTERVNLFLPVSAGTLPLPGTPVPEFDAVSVDGEPVDRGSFAGTERVFAVLSTGCGACEEQLRALAESGPGLVPRPVVLVAGAPADRTPMVAQLHRDAVVIEEPRNGPVAAAFELSEFPAMMLIRDGYIQQAEHRLAEVLAHLGHTDASPRG